MDHLSVLFEHFSPSAKVFFTGNLCATSGFDASDGLGHLHVLRAGTLQVSTKSGVVTIVDEPSLLLHPRPVAHQLKPVHDTGVDLVCASIDLGSGLNNPLVTALPDLLHVKLSDVPKLAPTLSLLFEESATLSSGQQAALDRLTEYLLILLLRYFIDTGHMSVGILAGLSDSRLHKAIQAIHDKPRQQWTLDELAAVSAMSRARFAHRFKEKTGTTPLHYLTQWRISVACSMLRKGSRIDRIADMVGYKSQSAFTRAFTKHIGLSPLEWLAAQTASSEQMLEKH